MVLENAHGVAPSMKNGIYKEKQFYAETGTPCLRMYNIDAGQLLWKDIKYMTLTRKRFENTAFFLAIFWLTVSTVGNLSGKACQLPAGIGPCVLEAKTSDSECVPTLQTLLI